MGVLKVWDGSDWRKVGCGGGPSGVWDDFTRADNSSSLGTSSSGHAWTALSGTWGISSNTALMTGGTGVNSSAVLETSLADCTVSVHIATGLPGGGGLCFRAVDNNNKWFWVLDNSGGGNGSSLYKSVGGAFTQVATGLAAFGSDTMEVALSGSSITLKKNGATVGTYTDSTHASATKHGLHGYAGYEVFDDFSIDGAGPSQPGRLRLQLPDGSWVVEVCDDDSTTETDDFNRADSSTSIGGTGWIETAVADGMTPLGGGNTRTAGVMGISGNRAYVVNDLLDNTFTVHPAVAMRSGAYDFDMTVKVPTVGNLVAVFRADPTNDPTYGRYAKCWVMNKLGQFGWDDYTTASFGADFYASGDAVSAGDIVRITGVGSTIEYYLNGSLAGSFTDSRSAPGYTHHGFGGTLGAALDFDDFTLITPPDAHPLKIEDPANPGTWITVACFRPV